MAIVKMKKLRVVALAGQRDELLRALQRLGCVEISEPDALLDDPQWAELLRREAPPGAEIRTEIADVSTALSATARYGSSREGLLTRRPAVTEQAFLEDGAADAAKATSEEINELLRTLQRLQSEAGRMAARRAGLTPWADLDLPLETQGTAHTLFRPGVVPGATDLGAVRNQLAASDAAAELLEISADKQQRYLLLICHRADEDAAMEALRACGFSAVTFPDLTGTPEENIRALDRCLADNEKQQAETEAALSARAGSRAALRLYADRLDTEANRAENAGRLLTDGTILFFEGWCPAESVDKVGALLDGKNCAWEAADPAADEIPAVPVSLKNNWFTRPLNMVTDMYSLPSYDGVDPNPLMAPFFIFFYGFMMADMGYGLLMMLAALVVMKKAPPNGPTMRHMIPLLGYCGVSTFLFGAATGGFFGDFLTQVVKLTTGGDFALPALFSPLDDAVPVLIASLILGVLQVFVGMGVSMYRKIRQGETVEALCGEGAWYLVFVLGGVAALGVLSVKAALIAILVLLVLTQGYGKKGFGVVTGIFGSLYNGVTGYFSDILSYSRLMALMLAGAVVAQVFNQLGAMTGNVITFVLISAIGNALNFALNLLGCYVHDMRLQCLEFFGRFYSDGGKPFDPLSIRAKNVDVVQ